MKVIVIFTGECYISDRFDIEARAKMLFESLLHNKRYSGHKLLSLILLAQDQVTVIRVLLEARRTGQNPNTAYQKLVDDTKRRAFKLGLAETLDLDFIESKECEEIICNILLKMSSVKRITIRDAEYDVSTTFPKTSEWDFSQPDEIIYKKVK